MSPTHPQKIISIDEHFLLILSQKSKNIKNRKISVFDPCTFSLFRSEKVNFGKSHFSANWKTWKFSDLKRSIIEISAKFHRDFIEISLVASQKRRKKENFFTCLRPFFEKLASTLTASISAPLQDRNFKFCRHIPYPTH